MHEPKFSPLRLEHSPFGLAAHTAEAIGKWLIYGNVGESSKLIAARALGVPLEESRARYPLDPSDLKRCLDLLDILKDQTEYDFTTYVVGDLAWRYPHWKALYDHWEELEAMLREEENAGSEAPKTYALMRKLLEAVDKNV